MANYIVFGATGGIGTQVCQHLADSAHAVTAVGRNEEKIRRLNADGKFATAFCADPTSFLEVSQCVEAVVEEVGEIYGIISCIGSLFLKPAHLTTETEWDDVISTNLASAFAVVRIGGKVLARSGGAIVLSSSAAALTGFANHEAIAAAKAGVIGLTRSAAATYGAKGIRVNAVAPGLVQTELTSRILRSEASQEASKSMHVLGRLGEPCDVARAIGWLADPAQSWVTGQVLGIDGGLSSIRPRVPVAGRHPNV